MENEKYSNYVLLRGVECPGINMMMCFIHIYKYKQLSIIILCVYQGIQQLAVSTGKKFPQINYILINAICLLKARWGNHQLNKEGYCQTLLAFKRHFFNAIKAFIMQSYCYVYDVSEV